VDFLIFDWGKCNYPLYIYSDIYLSFFFYIKKHIVCLLMCFEGIFDF
jgi:hypothetical protein